MCSSDLRRNNAKYISSQISKYKQLKLPSNSSEYENIFQMYTIRLENKKLRDELHKFLISNRIFSKVYFNPIHLTSFYKEKFNTKKGDLPITEKISDQVLTLPIYPNMTKEERDYLVESISRFFEISE